MVTVCVATDLQDELTPPSLTLGSDEQDTSIDLRPLPHPLASQIVPVNSDIVQVSYDDVVDIEYRPAEFHPVALRRYRNSYCRRCREVCCTTEKLAYLAFLISLITALSLVIYFRQ